MFLASAFPSLLSAARENEITVGSNKRRIVNIETENAAKLATENYRKHTGKRFNDILHKKAKIYKRSNDLTFPFNIP